MVLSRERICMARCLIPPEGVSKMDRAPWANSTPPCTCAGGGWRLQPSGPIAWPALEDAAPKRAAQRGEDSGKGPGKGAAGSQHPQGQG